MKYTTISATLLVVLSAGTSILADGTARQPVGASQTLSVSTEDTAIQVCAATDSLAVVSLRSPGADFDWCAGNRNPAVLPLVASAEVRGQSVPLHWQFVGAQTGRNGEKLLVWKNANPALELRSAWRAAKGPGPVEHTLTLTNLNKEPILLPLQKSLTFSSHAPDSHTLEHWSVEKGANWPSDVGVLQKTIEPRYQSSQVSTPYAPGNDIRPDYIPWTCVQDVQGRQGWYAGIEFSGLVRTELHQSESGDLALCMGIGRNDAEDAAFRTRLAPGESFNAPPVFVGCYKGDVDDGCNHLRRWVEANLRPATPLPNVPLLTNNSWGSGMAVDEKLARSMIDSSGEMGLENFHIDAGWFRAVGDWHPDPVKFPQGLAPVADYAHAKGLRFGLWIGWTQGGPVPDATGNRAALSFVDPQMKSWFTRDYAANWKMPRPFTGADVCLADPKAEDWCLRDLRRCVTEYKLDLLEHDQVMIIDSCQRDSHRHTASPLDAAYHATQAYYRIYDTLRAENPSLVFEDCVNGGRMVDYGAVRRNHYICLTDTLFPLTNRRAFYDAAYALPPSMCECYVEKYPVKTLKNFVYMLRSGMMGWCTIMLDMNEWTPEQRTAGKRQFDLYKQKLRPLINSANLYHVSERPDRKRCWDGMLYVDTAAHTGVLYAFRGTGGEESHRFQLKGLNPTALYAITFEDNSSPAQQLTGAALMKEGVEVNLPETESSELVWLDAVPAGAAK